MAQRVAPAFGPGGLLAPVARPRPTRPRRSFPGFCSHRLALAVLRALVLANRLALALVLAGVLALPMAWARLQALTLVFTHVGAGPRHWHWTCLWSC